MSLDTYTALVTSQYKNKTKFMDLVEVKAKFQVRLQEVLASMVSKFDIDTAVGDQLDIIGKWAGVSRFVNIPLVGVYFEWEDGTVGWEDGEWKGVFDPDTGIVELEDEPFRTLVKTKIAANRWDGTVEGAYEIYATVFPDTQILIQDLQDMTMIVGFAGTPPDAVTQALISAGYLALKPEGVQIRFYAIGSGGPLFGWDIDTTTIDGWDVADWPEEI